MNGTRRRRLAALSLLVVLATASCSDDGDDTTNPAPEVDLTGRWSFTASASSPPRAVACTGDLSPLAGTELCDAFELNLEQIEAVLVGNQTKPFCDAIPSMVATVSGTSVSGSVTLAAPLSIRKVTFDGVVSTNSGTFDPDVLTETGSTGSCSLSGSYNAARIAAE